MREAKQVEDYLLEEVGTGQHKGSRSRTVAELLERWFQWRQRSSGRGDTRAPLGASISRSP